VTAALALWVAVDWPHALGAHAFPLTLVPPERMAQVLGIVATIAFAFVLSAWSRFPGVGRSRIALVSGALAGLFTALGGRTLRSEGLPTLPIGAIAFTALVVALVVGLAVLRPDSPLALAALPLLAVLVVVAANPLQRGFGDLRSSPAAAAVRSTGAMLGDDGYWASDDPAVDALLMSNGQPSLSGQQWIGPRESAWRILDPADDSRTAWNRGASYIVFRWQPGAPIRIRTLARDLIEVRADPCAPVLRQLGLRLVVSQRRLAAGCLIPRGTIPWGYAERLVYALPASPP
jgi:hypothetical protein